MPEDNIEPIANTQMFRRFAADPEPVARRGTGGPWLVVSLVVLALVLGGVVVWLAAS
jgi:hypothetical protein